jgi:hypothetical protein
LHLESTCWSWQDSLAALMAKCRLMWSARRSRRIRQDASTSL